MVLLAKSFFHHWGTSGRAFFCACELVYHQLLPVRQCLSAEASTSAGGCTGGCAAYMESGEGWSECAHTASGTAYLPVKELLYRGEALLAVHAAPDFLTILVPDDREDNGWNIVVPPYGVQQLDLLRFWPYNLWEG